MKVFNVIVLILCIFDAFVIGENHPEFSSPDGWTPLETLQASLNVEQKQKNDEKVLDALTKTRDEGLEQCYGRRCLSQDHCCEGSACVDVKGEKVAGMCLPIYGRNSGDFCAQDGDCASGLICGETGNTRQPKSCQVEGRELKKKKYNDECSTSGECDVSKGLCCQVQKRHRLAPRKVCYYFLDPKSCIGHMEGQEFEPLQFMPNPFFKARIG